MTTSFVRNVQGAGRLGSQGTSTGCPSLDGIVGGVPGGAVILVEEDAFDVYSYLCVKAFVADGLYRNETVLLVRPEHRSNIVQELPTRVRAEPATVPAAPSQQPSGLTIAWRYQDMPSQDVQSAEHFDFGMPITEQELQRHSLSIDKVKVVSIKDLPQELEKLSAAKSAFRVAISNLTSPSFSLDNQALLTLIFNLKAALRRNPLGSALATVNPNVLATATRHRLHNLSDCAIQLTGFDGQQSAYPDYEGTLTLHKLAKVNTMGYQKKLETADLGFQMKRNHRYLVFDKLCLPPELGDAPSRTACAGPSLANKKLDF